MKIRTKSILLFLGLSLIPLIGMGKFAYENGRQAIKQNLGLAFQQLAHTQIENVENNMEEVRKSVERWSKMSIMQEVVIGDMDATIQSFLLDVKKENKNFTHISVMNSEGTVIASTLPEMLGKNFRAARADKPRVDDVHYSDISGEWEVTFSFPIEAQFTQDQIIGSFMAGWNAATLSRMVHLSAGGGTEQEGKNNHFMLMRHDGLVIAAPDFEKESIFKNNLVKRGLRSALLASRKQEGYLVEKDEHGAESLIGYDYAKGQNDFPDLGWFGVVLLNTDRAFASIKRLEMVIFFSGLIVVFIVGILSVIASGKMTTPLMNIARAVDKVAQGDFQTRVTVNSKDEFGQLAAAFNTMTEDLQGTTVSKEYVDNIIANMNNSLIVLTPRMEIQLVNEATRALLGYTDEELLGQPFNMLLTGSPSGETSIHSRMERLGDNEVVRNEEIQYRTKDGRAIDMLFSSANLKNKNNKLNGLVCVAQDITERREAETQRNRLAATLHAVQDAVIITDIEGIIEYVNPAFERVTGYGVTEALGRKPNILKSGIQNREFYRNLWETILGGKIWTAVIVNKKKDGTLFTCEQSVTPIKDATGRTVNFAGILHDITKRQEMENNLKEANRDLVNREKALRQTFQDLSTAHEALKTTQNQLVQSEKLASIGHLAAGVAHEINNPVGFISSNMEMLEQYIADYAKVLKMADHLKESVEQENLAKTKSIIEEMARLNKEINLDYIISDTPKLLEHNRKGIERIRKIVNDLRAFSREDKNVMERVKIEEVIEGILTIVTSEIKYKARLEKDYGDTPPIECSPQRLGQVFINLIINALHAIEGTGTIAIKTYTQDEFVCVDVRDTGKGIPPEILNKIFDPFFTTKPTGQGTGLGLSVSYEIIKKHNGSMTVRSKVGEGTTFTVMLPINQEKEETS
ncbi:MAG TPA: hypothetical protein DE315_03240 [Candidatus Omnitrophica bacterium]|nr:hypothetical protein [Candidatus Omnitrophota bacterium]